MKIIWLADNFIDSPWVGGAELSSQALIDKSPYDLIKIKVENLTESDIEKYACDLWVLDNIMTTYSENKIFALVLNVIQRVMFVKIEYDYNWCLKRSPLAHKIILNTECNCLTDNTKPFGVVYGLIHARCLHMFFMSMQQLYIHKEFMGDRFNFKTSILSSCFSDSTIDNIALLRKNPRSDIWLIMDGRSPWHKFCKGVDTAIEFAKQNNLNTKLIGGVDADTMFNEICNSNGVIFLPNNLDTCPRVVIEAKLMGRGIICNANVQHKEESWFKDATPDGVESYIRGRPEFFWNTVKELI